MAKNYRKSDYAKNVGRSGIVYTDVNERSNEITYELCLKENPGLTYEKFQEIKKFSDANYHIQANADNRESYHAPFSLDANRETEVLSSPSVEDVYFAEKRKRYYDIDEVVEAAYKVLTPLQLKRFLQVLEGKSSVKIAKEEGKNQKTIWESISESAQKIKKFLK